jgi:predicted Zn-dependent peptidase
MENLGAELGGYTEREHMVLTLTCHREALEKTLPLFLSLLQIEDFSPRDVEVEKAIILSEIIQAKDDPEDRVFELMWEKSFPTDHPILGTAESVARVTPGRLAEFYTTRLRKHPLISLAGDFDSDACIKLLRSGIPWINMPGNTPTIPKRLIPVTMRCYEQFQSEAVYLLLNLWQDPLENAQEAMTQGVFHHLLGDNLTSPLFKRFREEEGLCYQIGSFGLDHSFVSSLTIMTILPQGNMSRFFDLWDQFVHQIPESFNPEIWLQGIRNYQLLQEMSGDSMEFRMKNNAEHYLSYGSFPQNFNSLILPDIHYKAKEFSGFALGPVEPW